MDNRVSRKGSFLERSLARIFDKAGFEVSINSKKFGFETDILVTKGEFTILVEAKQYENSYLNVGSLLHEWHSKGKNSGADRVLVVITGIKISEKFYQLAKELGIYLWDEEIFHELVGIEGNRSLYRQICTYLDFGDVMRRFEQIDNSNLSKNQVYNLQNQAIELDDLEFQRELEKSVKDRKEKEELINKDRKEKEELINKKRKIFEENLDRARKKAKIFKRIKIWFVVLVIIFLGLFIYFRFDGIDNKNNQVIENFSNSQEIDIQVQKTSEEKLLDFCKLESKKLGYNVKIFNSYYFDTYNSASIWIEDKYPNDGLEINSARFFKEFYLDKAEFPIYVIDVEYWIDEHLKVGFTESGVLRVCDKNGIVEK